MMTIGTYALVIALAIFLFLTLGTISDRLHQIGVTLERIAEILRGKAKP